ncbi:hypothetical protein [Chitinophaga sp. Cy-1792]|uniref:hypothetical protein n=1 Tax=Chitinophaga sp. Cy-1792 TaxID=2608339 RepID=UPI001420F49F|nr:hypothetical protein [Chitinophaga sp. Cy-1792]NIG54371.1 hypothetical protein [Chitinophaga sp. Cy-1792]
MKKILLLAATASLLAIGETKAQNILDAAKKATGTTSSTGNLSNLTSGIMGQLTPSLGLNNTQQPKVTDLVSGFLKQKAGIMPLQQTNPTEYTSKFKGLQGGLFSKLKGVFTAAQYAKFLGLKPKASDATNVLSQLFF